MKKRINEILNGIIEYETVKPQLSTEYLEGTVQQNQIFRGTFSVKAPEGKSMQGFVHCTNARIGWKPESFYGYYENFVFEADTTGLLPGEVIEGEFVLNTLQGELLLPFAITIETKKNMEPEREYSMDEFTALAKEDFVYAVSRFQTVQFQKNLRQWGAWYETLYRGIREQKNPYLALEQFLIACGKKEAVRFTLENTKLSLTDLKETIREEFFIRKDNWGYATFTVESDSDLLILEQTEVTTEDFIGSVYRLSFMIDETKLHAGRNYAGICIRCGFEELKAEVEIYNEKKLFTENNLQRQKQEIVQMMSVYLDYHTEKLGKSEWISISLNTIENYKHAGGTHIFFDLYYVYLLLQKDEKSFAEDYILGIGTRKEELKDPVMYGLYLKLTTWLNTNENYQELIRDHIRTLYLQNQESWLIQWLILQEETLFIQTEFEKMDILRRQFDRGCNSPLMYLEVYKIIKREPLMLRKLEKFEIHVMAFLCREHLLDQEICGQVAQIACRMQKFDPVLFRILCRCYQVFPTRNMLTAICSMLIHGRKREEKYASWYALGIKSDVRITGLYEYFVETTTDLNDKLLPQSVRMYFIYHNTLDYGKKAAIYANIVRNRDKDSQYYESYRPSMERFAEEQLLERHINKELAFLYEELLTTELFTEELAGGLERLLFTHEIQCQNGEIRTAIILYEEFEDEQRVAFHQGTAYAQILSRDAVILLEDMDGNRYTAKNAVKIQRVLKKKELEDVCRTMLKTPTAVLLHDCTRENGDICITEESLTSYIRLLEVQNLKKTYVNHVKSELIAFFAAHPEHELLPQFVNVELKKAWKKDIRPEQIANLSNILSAQDRYDLLYQMVCIYGMERVPVTILVKMCSFCITKQEYEEDGMMLAVCEYCFERQVYDEVMLRYLMRYYEGSVVVMKQLWKTGRDFGLESLELEERIMTLLIFTKQNLEGTEEIFQNYYFRPGKAVLCKAYAILQAYEFFVREKKVDEMVFRYVEETMLEKGNMVEVAYLALMKYYCSLAQKSETQIRNLRRMVQYCLEQGMRFAFFRELPEKMKISLNLHDKFIVEYRVKPGQDVVLHYQVEGKKEESVLMKEAFEGIYTKEFTLFYGDSLSWYFSWKNSGERIQTPKKKITCQKRPGKDGITRYDLINRMLEAKGTHKKEKYREAKEQYMQQQYLVDIIFPVD